MGLNSQGVPVPATWPIQANGQVYSDDLNAELTQQVGFLVQPPRFKAVEVGMDSIVPGISAAVGIDTIVYTSPSFSTSFGTGSGIIGVGTPGVYLVNGWVPFNSGSTTNNFRARLDFYTGGVDNVIEGEQLVSVSGGHITPSYRDLVYIPANQQLIFQAYQGSGSTVNPLISTTSPVIQPSFSMRWVACSSNEAALHTYSSVPNPRTWNTNDLVTTVAASDSTHGNFNTEIRDPLRFFSQVPYCRAAQTSATTVASSTWTNMTNMAVSTSPTMDNYGAFSSNTWTCQLPGVYLFIGQVSFVAGATTFAAKVGLNATLSGTSKIYEGGGCYSTGGGANQVGCCMTKYLRCSAGDTVKLAGWQDQGSSNTTVTALEATRFAALWVGA